MRIAYITGTRADYGLMSSVLRELDSSSKLDLNLIVTGIHMMKEFGSTEQLIKKDEFKAHYIDCKYEEDNLAATPKFLACFLPKLIDKLTELKTELILILGDRAEMLAGAIAGQYLNIPVAHISGGDMTGHVDAPVRHAISKLAHIHFTISKKSAQRLMKMGEDPARISVVGATSLDYILHTDFPKIKEIAAKYNLDLSEPYIIMIQHPVITEIEANAKNIKTTLDAIAQSNIQTLVIYPNADATGRIMIREIEKRKEKNLKKAFTNVEYKEYIALLKNASAIIGNSSSGIVEAPSFGLPCINIGPRQNGRDKAENVIDVSHDKSQIIKAIDIALNDRKFKSRCKNCKSPYGNGTSGKKIRAVLEKLKIDKKLLVKEWSI